MATQGHQDAVAIRIATNEDVSMLRGETDLLILGRRWLTANLLLFWFVSIACADTPNHSGATASAEPPSPFGSESLLTATSEIVTDLQQWSDSASGDAVAERDQRSAATTFILLLLEIERFDIARLSADKLGLTEEYLLASHPILLSRGELELADEAVRYFEQENPPLRDYLVTDMFVAIACSRDLDSAYQYLQQRSGTRSLDSSRLTAALARVAQQYRRRGDADFADQVIANIESEQDRAIARALMDASNEPYSLQDIEPVFLRIMQRRSSVLDGNRLMESWFVERVRAYAELMKGHVDAYRKKRSDIEAKYPVKELQEKDRAICLGLDVLSLQAEQQVTRKRRKIDSRSVTDLQKKFFDSTIRGQAIERMWIAYVLSRTGIWSTTDVRQAWRSRSKFDSPEWIIGFAAGFCERGRDDIVDRLVELTDADDARCCLRIGKFAERFVVRAASSRVARANGSK